MSSQPKKPARDTARIRRISTSFGHMTLLHARYMRQQFARHAHNDFPVGVIEAGALGFEYRGEYLIAPEGSVNLANPGEAHTGRAAAETGWTYRMFYLDLGLMRRIAAEITGTPEALPFFASGVLHDPALAAALRVLHRACDDGTHKPLEQEMRLLQVFGSLIIRHADTHPQPARIGAEPQAVTRAKAYIEAHCAENITLDDLARAAYLSPFHLARVFQRETGLPPHAYLLQTRILRAKALLAQGRAITDAAYEFGFVDQSHFHRHFKRIVGLTPGEFSKMIQDKSA